jgi:hypothetical protein
MDRISTTFITYSLQVMHNIYLKKLIKYLFAGCFQKICFQQELMLNQRYPYDQCAIKLFLSHVLFQFLLGNVDLNVQ